MLTEKEKEWLEGRKSMSYPAPCLRMRGMFDLDQTDCEGCCLHETHFFKGCPLATDFRDAAEFEARVAAKLVGELQYECVCSSCQYNTHGCRTARMSYKQCRLKHARLAVEAEMEQ